MQLGGPGVGREAASELWDWGGRNDLHEGVGMVGGRQLQRPPSFWPATAQGW